MRFSDWAMWYCIVGLLYVIINGFVRKIYQDDDMFLPLMHFMIWWMFFLGLTALAISELNRKRKARRIINEVRRLENTK